MNRFARHMRLPQGMRRLQSAVDYRLPFRRSALAARHTRQIEAAITAALEPSVQRRFVLDRPLPERWGTAMPERLVEFPWLMAALDGTAPGLTLDAGSTLNHPYVLDHVLPRVRALHIVTLAPEAKSFPERGVSYLYADLRDLPLRAGLYDTVVSLSTLEHVGMDVSGYNAHAPVEPDPQQAAIQAAQELRRVAKPGGRILLSVPFGRPDNLGWLRQFDEAALSELIHGFGAADFTVAVYMYAGDQWQLSSPEEAAGSASLPFWASAVACVDLRLR